MVKPTMLTLIELTQKKLDAAAKTLGNAIRIKEESEKQLRMLIQYRGDYQQRFEQASNRGLNVSQFNNFQSFIIKLDAAVDGQKRLIIDAEYKVQAAKNHWQEIERKRLSYNTIINRDAEETAKKENKRDQKQTDEHANRALFYKHQDN